MEILIEFSPIQDLFIPLGLIIEYSPFAINFSKNEKNLDDDSNQNFELNL